LLWATYAHADFTGNVVAVSDGDTITVLRGSEQVKVRLAQIDAPEKGQAFWQKSKQALAGLVHGKQVQVVEHGLDKYRRTIGGIYLDGLDVNAEQVRQGMAWVFLRYSKSAGLIQLQAEAKEQRRGLWFDSEPVPPWEWRKQKRAGPS